MLRCPTPFRGLVLGLALAAGSVLSVHGTSSYAEEKSREQELADLEKQIQALTKRLEELRKTPAETTSSLPDATIPAEWIKALTWRSIGPANMGGRITAISVFEADPTTYWVATASGGLIKTSNNGNTFEHQFDREATVSIGDVCVAPSDRNVVWVGTGENNPRNSVSYGDGVYKSTDGGKTFTRITKGLPTVALGRMGLDWYRKDPNVVYLVVDSERIATGPPGSAGGDGYLGIIGEDADAGARLTQVTPNGPAEKAGL